MADPQYIKDHGFPDLGGQIHWFWSEVLKGTSYLVLLGVHRSSNMFVLKATLLQRVLPDSRKIIMTPWTESERTACGLMVIEA